MIKSTDCALHNNKFTKKLSGRTEVLCYYAEGDSRIALHFVAVISF